MIFLISLNFSTVRSLFNLSDSFFTLVDLRVSSNTYRCFYFPMSSFKRFFTYLSV